MKELYLLSRKQFNRIIPFFPRPLGKPHADDQRINCRIFFVFKTAIDGGMRRLSGEWNNTLHRRKKEPKNQDQLR